MKTQKDLEVYICMLLATSSVSDSIKNNLKVSEMLLLAYMCGLSQNEFPLDLLSTNENSMLNKIHPMFHNLIAYLALDLSGRTNGHIRNDARNQLEDYKYYYSIKQ